MSKRINPYDLRQVAKERQKHPQVVIAELKTRVNNLQSQLEKEKIDFVQWIFQEITGKSISEKDAKIFFDGYIKLKK